MKFNVNLLLYSGVMTNFVNSIMKVGITNKGMIDVTVILSWVNNDVFNKYIGESYVTKIITRFFMDEQNKWID